ncbi:MAG: hypothetical protein KAX78_02220, partial [Phycisphaerae bacterium]|nr:hypothetical protein [Phycisphaerae bacterium]
KRKNVAAGALLLISVVPPHQQPDLSRRSRSARCEKTTIRHGWTSKALETEGLIPPLLGRHQPVEPE